MRRTLLDEARRAVGGSMLRPLHSAANRAIGERRSKAVGAGIEFAQHRKYEPGDDLRYLDHNLYVRSGDAWIRQFHLDQRMRVSILLDATASVGVYPEAWRCALGLAAAFGVAALNGADECRFGIMQSERVAWGPSVSRRPLLEQELERIERTSPRGGGGSLAELAAGTLEGLQDPGMLVVISDWLVEEYHEALQRWRVRGQEIVAVQVLGGAEAGRPGSVGRLRLVDSETGEVVERRIDGDTWRRYRAAVAAWSDRVQEAVWAAEGRWLSFDAPSAGLATVVPALRRRGVLT